MKIGKYKLRKKLILLVDRLTEMRLIISRDNQSIINSHVAGMQIIDIV